MSAVPQSCRQQSGLLISTPLDSDKVVNTPTVMCAHCGRHWAFRPGSGRRRGFCLRCYGYVCGKKECDACIPLEQLLENLEAGMVYDQARQFRPVRASVPCAVPKEPKRIILS